MLLYDSVLMVSLLEFGSVWQRKTEMQNQAPGHKEKPSNFGHIRTLQ
jgi:hypothetical protein